MAYFYVPIAAMVMQFHLRFLRDGPAPRPVSRSDARRALAWTVDMLRHAIYANDDAATAIIADDFIRRNDVVPPRIIPQSVVLMQRFGTADILRDNHKYCSLRVAIMLMEDDPTATTRNVVKYMAIKYPQWQAPRRLNAYSTAYTYGVDYAQKLLAAGLRMDYGIAGIYRGDAVKMIATLRWLKTLGRHRPHCIKLMDRCDQMITSRSLRIAEMIIDADILTADEVRTIGWNDSDLRGEDYIKYAFPR